MHSEWYKAVMKKHDSIVEHEDDEDGTASPLSDVVETPHKEVGAGRAGSGAAAGSTITSSPDAAVSAPLLRRPHAPRKKDGSV
jgi:hypothetical protein